MNKYYYDFHIHSCLSPCADNDMTPANIAGMASIVGLNVLALTDHNSCKNCPAFFKAAKQYGIIPIAGMELTTMEDIHVVCLFEELEDAMAFSKAVEERRMKIPNRPDLFGDQLIMDEEDNVIGIEENLLIYATAVTIDEVPAFVEKFGGVCYPAHIDRTSNGIIATLGTFPEEPYFPCAEINQADKTEEYKEKYPIIKDKKILMCSDAHHLWDIREENAFMEIDDEPYSSKLVRSKIFESLRNSL